MNNEVLAKSIFTCAFNPFSPLHADVERLRGYNDDSLLADHFAECADVLVDMFSRDPNPTVADRHLQPILYLYRHALELDLKSLIREAEKMDITTLAESERENLLKYHGLIWLWDIVKDRVWDQLGPVDEEQTRNLEDRLREIDEIDPRGQAFRYARLKNGKSSLEKAPEVLDLGLLRDVIAGIRCYLQGCLEILAMLRQASDSDY